MSPPVSFRNSDLYKKKYLRVGAALQRYSQSHLPRDKNINSLSQEADALEELSLAAYGLMKVIKESIKQTAKLNVVLPRTCACEILGCDVVNCACTCHVKKEKSCIIQLGSGPFEDR